MTAPAATGFDRQAADYDQHATMQRDAAAWLAEWLPGQIDDRALELGAGTGLFTRHLVDRAANLTATDLSPRMVEQGRANFPRVEWLVADANRPPNRPSYHWIFSSSLLQWIPAPLNTFRRWHEITEPGAKILGGWFIRGTLQSFYDTFPGAKPFVWRSAEEWEELLSAAGWQTVRRETRRYVRRYDSSLDMLRDIHRTGAVVPKRYGTGQLRAILRDHDGEHGPNITAEYFFIRLEATRQ